MKCRLVDNGRHTSEIVFEIVLPVKEYTMTTVLMQPSSRRGIRTSYSASFTISFPVFWLHKTGFKVAHIPHIHTHADGIIHTDDGNHVRFKVPANYVRIAHIYEFRSKPKTRRRILLVWRQYAVWLCKVSHCSSRLRPKRRCTFRFLPVNDGTMALVCQGTWPDLSEDSRRYLR